MSFKQILIHNFKPDQTQDAVIKFLSAPCQAFPQISKYDILYFIFTKPLIDLFI